MPALAALTRDEGAWLNQATTRLREDPELRAVAQAGDPARFAQLFGAALTAQLVNAPARLADLAVDGDDLVDELHAVIQHYVYAKAREPEPAAGPAPVASAATAAAVAATAFQAATKLTGSRRPPSPPGSR